MEAPTISSRAQAAIASSDDSQSRLTPKTPQTPKSVRYFNINNVNLIHTLCKFYADIFCTLFYILCCTLCYSARDVGVAIQILL